MKGTKLSTCAFLCAHPPLITQQATAFVVPRRASTVSSSFRFRSFSATENPNMEYIPPPYGSLPKEERVYVLNSNDTTTQYLGTMPLRSGQLLVTDPCNGKVHLSYAIVNVLPHDAYHVERTFDSDWEFVSLTVYHPNYYDPDGSDVELNEVAHRYIRVDSGLLSFSDVNHKVPLGNITYDELCTGLIDWYGTKVATAACDDGGYLLLVGRNKEDEIVAVMVQ